MVEETPTPGLVAAWLVMGTLRAESVPMWAANWLVQGYDGMSLAELAGLGAEAEQRAKNGSAGPDNPSL